MTMVAVRETIIYLIVFCALLPPAKKFAKVMFLQLSVSHSVHGGGSASAGGALGRPPPPPFGYYGIRSIRGRYASYWNAFLLNKNIHRSLRSIYTKFYVRYRETGT